MTALCVLPWSTYDVCVCVCSLWVKVFIDNVCYGHRSVHMLYCLTKTRTNKSISCTSTTTTKIKYVPEYINTKSVRLTDAIIEYIHSLSRRKVLKPLRTVFAHCKLMSS